MAADASPDSWRDFSFSRWSCSQESLSSVWWCSFSCAISSFFDCSCSLITWWSALDTDNDPSNFLLCSASCRFMADSLLICCSSCVVFSEWSCASLNSSCWQDCQSFSACFCILWAASSSSACCLMVVCASTKATSTLLFIASTSSNWALSPDMVCCVVSSRLFTTCLCSLFSLSSQEASSAWWVANTDLWSATSFWCVVFKESYAAWSLWWRSFCVSIWALSSAVTLPTSSTLPEVRASISALWDKRAVLYWFWDCSKRESSSVTRSFKPATSVSNAACVCLDFTDNCSIIRSWSSTNFWIAVSWASLSWSCSDIDVCFKDWISFAWASSSLEVSEE